MHLMIDLETLDNTPYSAMLEIGAVAFDPKSNEMGGKCQIYLNELKGSTSMDTLAWWLSQSQAATEKLAEGLKSAGALSLQSAMAALRTFAIDNKCTAAWSHGATFDIPILRTNAGRVNVQMPWKYWNEYDTRTLYMIKGKPTIEREGVHHNALDDAIYQAQCVQEVMAR